MNTKMVEEAEIPMHFSDCQMFTEMHSYIYAFV